MSSADGSIPFASSPTQKKQSQRRSGDPRDRSNRSFSETDSPRGSQTRSPGGGTTGRRRNLKSSSSRDIDSSLQRTTSVNSCTDSLKKTTRRRGSHSSSRAASSRNTSQNSAEVHSPSLGSSIFDHEKDNSETPKERRRQSRSSSPQKLKERVPSRRKPKGTSASNSASGDQKKGRYKSARSHSPAGRDRDTTIGSSKKNRSTKSARSEVVRPKSESSLDASKKSKNSIPIDFNDDTDIGTAAGKKKRRGRRDRLQASSSSNIMQHSQNHNSFNNSKSNSSTQEEMESELQQVLGSMNGSSKHYTGPLKDDALTLDTTNNSKASTKASSKSKSKKKSRNHGKSKESAPETPKSTGDTKSPKRTKLPRSSKSLTSKSSQKNKKKSKEETPKPRKSRKPKKLPPSANGPIPVAADPEQAPKKTKKKKTNRPKDASAKSVTEKSSGTRKAGQINGSTRKGNKPSTPKRSQSLDHEKLRRAASDREAGSSKSGPQRDKLKRARSLFGAVLNPKSAETVGDGDNSDNEYEGKRDNAVGGNGKGLLGWAKKKSPGFLKKRGLRVGRGADSEDDDRHGLLSNAEDSGGQMRLLNLVLPSPDQTNNKSKNRNKRISTGLHSVGEDNTIEESNEFDMPHLTAGNGVHKILEPPTGKKRISTVSEANTMRNSSIMDQNRPPFQQIIAGGDMIGVEDDDLSDIGDPEVNTMPMPTTNEIIEEGVNEGEIVMKVARNDVLYEDKGHPGTVRMIHVLREILVEHQDDIEYSPEVYKTIKRRLKGRKFLLPCVHNGQKAWRDASKSENVRLLADFFNEEMRQLGFGGADDIDQSGRRNSTTSGDGSIRDNLLSKAISEVKWALEIAKPRGDIEMMNVGIDAEEKLINLIEIAEAGSSRTQPLKEELDKLGELAKQMMYVSIAPLYERLDEIEERMADYFEQENAILDMVDDDSEGHGSRDMSLIERSVERDGESYEIAMKNSSYDDGDSFDGDENGDNDGEEMFDEEEEYDEEEYEEEEEVDEEVDGEEYEEDSDEESGTNVKEGAVLDCDSTGGDVSSVGESGIYDESDSDDDQSELEDGEPSEQPNWIDFEEEEDSDDESHTYEGTNNSSDDESDVSDEPKRKKSIFEEPNPKMNQFFDRLKHLFETRQRISECLASKDPGNKCQKIKPKTQSGGISKENGSYKKAFQQRDTNGKVVRNLDDLYDAARAAYPDFKSIVQQLVDEISGLDYKKHIILPQLKPRDRAWEKATTEYSNRDLGPPESWLYDICRASILCYTVKQVNEVSKWLQSNSNVVQAKNRFADPVYNGYRDLLYHVSIPYQDGRSHICEVQVHLKAIYDLNDQCGTIKHYDYFRPSFSNPWRSPADALSDLEKMNKYTKIEGPFMKRVLKSEDAEQILLFAEILRKNLEEHDRALELYRRVLGLQEEAHGSDNPEMAATYQRIGLVLGAMGDTDESLQNLLKALAIQESFLGADHIEVADTYVQIGHMLSKRGDYSGAYTQYQRTQLIRENKLGKEAFLVIKSIQDIGLVLQKKGDFVESQKEFRKALAIQRKVLGDDHIDIATTRSYLGETLCLYGDYEHAMTEDKLAFSMREKTLGKNHRSTADSHTAIGVLLFHTGDYKTSRWHHNKALRIRESMLGKGAVECAISHRHLGELLSFSEGDYEGAVKALKRAQQILEANVGMDNPVTAKSYLDLGSIHLRHGKHEDALAEYRRAKVILESNLGQTHPDTAFAYLCTGNALNLAGEQDEALSMHRKALVVFESVLGNAHPRTADGYQSIGDVFMASGNPELALPEHKEALKIRKSVLRNDHPFVAESCSRIGKILLTGCDNNGNRDKRDPEGALEIYRKALTITENRCGRDHPSTAAARLDVAFALMELAKDDEEFLDEAEEQVTATLDVLKDVEPKEKGKKPTKHHYLGFGEDAAVTGKACVLLGEVLERKGDTFGARDLFVEGLERLMSVLGGDHPETMKIESKLLSFVAES